MIAAWQVVVVLVPLCSASAFTGYAYARRLAEIDNLDEEDLAPAPPLRAPLPPMLARPEDDRIDLHERLGPFGPARSKPAS